MSVKYVLDACAVIAYLTGEDGSDVIEALINDAIDKDAELLMHKINLYEVFYDTWKAQNEAAAILFYDTFTNLPVSIIDSISDELMGEAARFKTEYRVSVADSFALAAAKTHGAALVTSDHTEFDPIKEKGDISFFWIR